MLTSDKIHYIIAKQVTERTTNKPPETSTIWNLSSAGRASALQAEGHRFEPYWSHLFAGVAELADAQDLKSCGTYTPVPVRPRSPAFITTAVVIIMEYSIRTCSSAG